MCLVLELKQEIHIVTVYILYTSHIVSVRIMYNKDA